MADTNPSEKVPDREAWSGFTVGRLVEEVDPAIHATPVRSTSIAVGTSLPAPPRSPEDSKPVPSAFSFVTNTSSDPWWTGPNEGTPGRTTMGKFVDWVLPAMKAFPALSV